MEKRKVIEKTEKNLLLHRAKGIPKTVRAVRVILSHGKKLYKTSH